MSIWRGMQSAAFYYLSCAPCTEASYRKKRKREAVRGRAERVELEREMGARLYRHPSPSSTNPHWAAEIALGPTMKRGKRKGYAGQEDSLRSKESRTVEQQVNASGSNLASSVDLPPKGESRSASLLNFNQYQREDEALWGSGGSEPPLRNYLDGSNGSHAPSRPATARTKDSSSSSIYHCYRNPPINDKHPAISRKVHSRDEVAWMLQPPPTPDVMKGKTKPPRSRSDSDGSRPTRASTANGPLSQHASAQLYKQCLQHDSTSATSLAFPPVAALANSSPRWPHDRGSGSSATDRIDFADFPSLREKRRPQPLQLKPESSDESAVTVIRKQHLAPAGARRRTPRKVASRPQLSTILSDSVVPSASEVDFHTPASTPKENSLPDPVGAGESGNSCSSSSGDYDKSARRSAVVIKDGTKLFQEDRPKHLAFNTTIFATSPVRLKHSDIRPDTRYPHELRQPVSHPPQHVDGGAEEREGASGGPEQLFDSWYSPDFALDQWVHEHTKREVRQRWSMDI
ncbi:hypothetical protein B0A50_06102 [Salinomyces thailandicus]|uniref:Uncharacterized protein n=1 Tax=Salinomyces thailandicus TaxID=706561 RepID=A0A4U0TS89_9PEZI|nr:hypothetical protein B0A50_06102 [Salinomyces thailandica]